MGQEQQRQHGRRQASAGEAERDPPHDVLVKSVNGAAADIGDAGVEKVGADRGRRRDAEPQHQERGHERSPADAGKADEHPDNKPGQGIKRVYGVQ